MILKHLPSFNVAIARLARADPTAVPVVVDFCHKFKTAESGEAAPGLDLHRVDDAKSRGVWSARASQELRAILRKRGPAWYAAHVGHHDQAYEWARRNAIEIPKTPALPSERSEFDEFMAEQGLPGTEKVLSTRADRGESMLFEPFDDRSLEELGVRHFMIPMLRGIRTSDEFIERVYPELPDGLGDRLFAALCGDFAPMTDYIEQGPDPEPDPEKPVPVRTPEVTEKSIEVLVEHPEATWAALPDAQQQALATGSFKGAVLVNGPAGSGKTVVALHRARHLAAQGHTVLLTTFTRALRTFLSKCLVELCSPDELARIEVRTVDYMARKLSGYDDSLFDEDFLKHDDFQRLCDEATRRLDKREAKHEFTAVVVDEIQDLDPPRLAFIQTLARGCRKQLMLLGDMDQRIYEFPCDLEDLGFEFGDRVFDLGTVYRSTLEITKLGRAILASHGGSEAGRLPFTATAYASGEAPHFRSFRSDEDEIAWAVARVLLLVQDGVRPEDIGIPTYRKKRRESLTSAFDAVGLGFTSGLNPMTMHAAKGLEFRATLVLDVNGDTLPNPWAGKHEKEHGTYGDWLERQRNLLYVAVTRASDEVFVAWAGRPSPFLSNALGSSTPDSGVGDASLERLVFDVSALSTDPAGLRAFGGREPLTGPRLVEALRPFVRGVLDDER